MSNELTATPATQSDARARHQRARIEQRHLQFGRHCRLDLPCLMRAAHRAQVAPPAKLVLERRDIATRLVKRSRRALIDHTQPEDAADVAARSSETTAMPDAPATMSRTSPGPATLGDFVASCGADAVANREWVATLADLTAVVVRDWCGAPSLVGVEKAVSIVQSRAYLEHRARLLLLPFRKHAESWRLATIDFGTAAQRHKCEFLMSFSVQHTSGEFSMSSQSVEIGFALQAPRATDPVFVLTVVTVAGLAT